MPMLTDLEYCRLLAASASPSDTELRRCLVDALASSDSAPFWNVTAASLVPIAAALIATFGVAVVLLQRFQADWATGSWKRIEWAIEQTQAVTKDGDPIESAQELGFLALTKILDDDRERWWLPKLLGIRLSASDIELVQAASRQADLGEEPVQ